MTLSEKLNSDNTARRDVLRSLLSLDVPLVEVLDRLGQFPWDSERQLVTLTPQHVVRVLRRFRRGELGAREVEHWADAVEGRDDIGLSKGHEDLLKNVIFDLANPAIQGFLDDRVADDLIAQLVGKKS